MKWCGSLEVAQNVVKELFKLTGKGEECIYIETFSNCREQGYAIINTTNINKVTQCNVVENRNSDNIRVYYGTSISGNVDGTYVNSHAFDHMNNHPENWEQSKFFDREQYKEAAKFIYDYLMGKADENKEADLQIWPKGK